MADLIYPSFKKRLLDGTVDLDTHTFKIALLTSASNALTSTLTGYAELTGEVASGNGYTTGGNALASVTLALAGSTVTFDAADPAWTAASFAARFAVIYDATDAGKSLVKVFDFLTDKVVSNGTMTLNFNALGILTLA